MLLKDKNFEKWFVLHQKCIKMHHSHLLEFREFGPTELKTIKRKYIPQSSNENSLGDEQIYSLKLKFFHIINGKIPFLKLEKEVKQVVTRLSLEEEISVKKNLQVIPKPFSD